MPPRYLPLNDLIQIVQEPYQSAFKRLLDKHADKFQTARGSSHNHQAWTGGYIDHICEVMNIAVVLHNVLGQLRPLSFSLSDALVVLFVHDLEKPWAYEQVGVNWRRREGAKENAHQLRLATLDAAGISLPPDLERAVYFAEGEEKNYSNRSRAMTPLAAFCHMCDVASARLWHDHPWETGDPWIGAGRSATVPPGVLEQPMSEKAAGLRLAEPGRPNHAGYDAFG